MDTQQIEKQLESVPEIIKKVFFSTEVAEQIAEIGEKNALLLDQINDLIEETGYMIIGLKRAQDYVDIISKKLNIDSKISRKISGEINDGVLRDVRDEIRKLNDEEINQAENVAQVATLPANLPTATPSAPAPSFGSLEKAGQFTIEKSAPPSTSSQYSNENISKDALLKSIEDKPGPVASPMIDHLLTAHVNTAENIEVKKIETVEVKPLEQKPVIEAKKSYTADPYREQF